MTAAAVTAQLTDQQLHDAAVEHARQVVYWRRKAAGARTALNPRAGLARRRCLANVRHYESRVVDLAIAATIRCFVEEVAAESGAAR